MRELTGLRKEERSRYPRRAPHTLAGNDDNSAGACRIRSIESAGQTGHTASPPPLASTLFRFASGAKRNKIEGDEVHFVFHLNIPSFPHNAAFVPVFRWRRERAPERFGAHFLACPLQQRPAGSRLRASDRLGSVLRSQAVFVWPRSEYTLAPDTGIRSPRIVLSPNPVVAAAKKARPT